MKSIPSLSVCATQPSEPRMRRRGENKWRKRQEYCERKFLFWRSISPPSQRVFPSPRLRWGKTREAWCGAPHPMRRCEVSPSPPQGNPRTDHSHRRWNIRPQLQHIFSNLNSLWPVKFWLNLTLKDISYLSYTEFNVLFHILDWVMFYN